MANILDPILPILSVLGYWAIILGAFGGPGIYDSQLDLQVNSAGPRSMAGLHASYVIVANEDLRKQWRAIIWAT